MVRVLCSCSLVLVLPLLLAGCEVISVRPRESRRNASVTTISDKAKELTQLAGRALRLVDQVNSAVLNAAGRDSKDIQRSPFAVLRSIFSETGLGTLAQDASTKDGFTYTFESKIGPRLSLGHARIFVVISGRDLDQGIAIDSLRIQLRDDTAKISDFPLLKASADQHFFQFDGDATTALIDALSAYDTRIPKLGFSGQYELRIDGNRVSLLGKAGKIEGQRYFVGLDHLEIIDTSGGNNLEKIEIRAHLEVLAGENKIIGSIDVNTNSNSHEDLSVKMKAAFKREGPSS